jgi:hypothetical protein
MHAHSSASDRVQSIAPEVQCLPAVGEEAGGMYPPKEAYMHLPH